MGRHSRARVLGAKSVRQDSDAITETIASREVNTIRHLVSLDQLVVLTSGAIWKAWPGTQVDVITPSGDRRVGRRGPALD
jgi:hypothetical protein